MQDLLDTTLDEKLVPIASVDNAHDLGIISIDVSNIVLTDGKLANKIRVGIHSNKKFNPLNKSIFLFQRTTL